ncbi:hypothetical protein [Nocardia concava]|uniref:hypothetical protein n=1 Tax=Nocardia concava TaxID=257281 RepID=UPI00031A9B5E|nr:hypothetical protein [Nocardia concava]
MDSHVPVDGRAQDRFRIIGSSGDTYDIAGATVGDAHGHSWLHECRDQAGRGRLFREYAVPLTDPEDLDRIGKVTATGRAIVLAAEQQAGAPVPISWPIDQVWRDGALAGVILPAVPAEFLDPDGRPRTLDRLYGPEGPVEPESRVAVAIRFCELFEMLERNELVHGDIAPANLLWSRTGVYLRDGDGLRSAQAVPVQRRSADGWGDPRVRFGMVTGPDRYSDRLGVALLVYRTLLLEANLPALVDGRWYLRSELPAGFDRGLRALIDRAFGDPAATATRPTAAEWRAALVAAAPPVVEPVGESVAPGPGFHPGPSTPRAPEPQGISGGIVGGIVAAVVVAVVLLVLGVRAVQSSDHSDASSSSTFTPYTYSTTSYVPPTSTTPPFNWSSLDTAATDKTPFTANALLPQSFRDAKGVNYTLRSSGVMDCITPDMSWNVKSLLRDYNCAQQVAGSYVDDSNKILVSVNVMAFGTTADADRLYNSIKGQTQNWAIWCPHEGAGAEVCEQGAAYARKSGYSSHQYRYVYESTALYINLTRDVTADEWMDPAAKAAVEKAGPENYWHK